MAKEKNMLLTWLRDAHAMEASAESILSKQIGRVKDYPRVHQRISDHLDMTRRQKTRLEGCIERMGGDTSVLKEMVGKFTGTMQAFGASAADDEVVKAMISNYQFESMEIASYQSLIVAANAYNEPEVARICKEILAEEETMAKWLLENVSEVTRTFLSKRGVRDVTRPIQPGAEHRSPPPA